LFLIHNVLPHEQKPWDRRLAKTALGHGDIFIVQTEHEEGRLQDLIPDANISVCSHPVYNMFSAASIPKPDAKNQLGISPDQRVLLFFGIVRPYKGLETLILALELLHTRGIKPTLIIAGEFWQDKANLLDLMEKGNVKDYVLIEDRYILNEEIPIYFCGADIFVAPYRKGTQSGVVKMALGFNLPIVLSQPIADSAIIDLENYPVYIMPPDDPLELANSLEIALQDLKAGAAISPSLKDTGWDEFVKMIEESLMEFNRSDELVEGDDTILDDAK
jgi:glycosyltransferase involved in cell wall biosynthesis